VNKVFHIPVFLEEVLHLASLNPPSLIMDGTLGDGGHSMALMEKFPMSSCMAFDRDPDMITRAEERLKGYADRIRIQRGNYSGIPETNLSGKPARFDFALLDLGISSYHLDESGRGFSFQDNLALDMRLDQEGKSALEIINSYKEKDLADLIFRYGEERKSRAIARKIVQERPWTSASQLGDALLSLFKRQARRIKKGSRKDSLKREIHPATRTFQALRIAVNEEILHLEKFLWQIPFFMAPGGILVIISFHSLEDRLVKWFMRYWERPEALPADIQVLDEKQKKSFEDTNGIKSLGRILTKKPIVANDEQIRQNPRSRSAKLRAFQFHTDNKA
jgi:16S rRNA (cytosine1402-N4)-methyltransferase